MKKLILIGFAICALIFNAYSESPPYIAPPLPYIITPPIIEQDSIYKYVEKMPEFPGGEKNLNKFIARSLKYPRYALENGIEGKAVVQFVVRKDGSIGDIEIVSSPHESLSNEAIRLIKLMPNWIPGTQKGEPVNVKYIFPVVFKL